MGTVFSDGMDSVNSSIISGSITDISSLSDIVEKYVEEWLKKTTGSSPSPSYIQLFGTLIPTTINDYQNMKITPNLNATQTQLSMINSVISGVKFNTLDSLDSFFDGVDEQIAICNSNNTSKQSIYIASAIARASSSYWQKYLDTNSSGTTGWNAYLNTINWIANYYSFPMWVNSSFLGSLSGFSQFQAAFVGQASYLNTMGIAGGQAGALISALGLAGGKIIFSLPLGPAKIY